MLKKGLYCAMLMAALLGMMSRTALAAVYTLPENGDSVLGSNVVASVKAKDTGTTFARRNDVGYYALLEANPKLDPLHVARASTLLVPQQVILPNAPRVGIVINLAELRLYYYPPDSNTVVTYPVGIGRVGGDWQTPTGELTIIEKVKDPDWHPPKLVVEDVGKRGIILPEVIPAGPDNPLGAYMLRLSNYSYLIHGTNRPEVVGRRTSAGCVDLYPEDIESLFNRVPVGTKVTIVNEPFKAGWLNEQLYVEAHTPLREQRQAYAGHYDSLLNEALSAATAARPANVDWSKMQALVKAQAGVAEVVGQAVNGAPTVST